MLCSAVSTNTAFDEIPDITNAVESHNRCSKGSSPDILKVALMATYKIDMAAALEHLAKRRGITTSYEDYLQLQEPPVQRYPTKQDAERELFPMMQKGHQTSIKTSQKVSL